MNWIITNTADLRTKSHVTIIEDNLKNLDDAADDFGNMEIIEGKKIKKFGSLFDIINNPDCSDFKETNDVIPFVNYPPDSKILPPKPILLDVCTAFLTYPDIEDKLPKQEDEPKNEGAMSKIAKGVWGLFGGKK